MAPLPTRLPARRRRFRRIFRLLATLAAWAVALVSAKLGALRPRQLRVMAASRARTRDEAGMVKDFRFMGAGPVGEKVSGATVEGEGLSIRPLLQIIIN